MKWIEIKESEAPSTGYWDVSGSGQGQAIETAYWRPRGQRSEAGEESAFRRVKDGGVGPWARYYRRAT